MLCYSDESDMINTPQSQKQIKKKENSQKEINKNVNSTVKNNFINLKREVKSKEKKVRIVYLRDVAAAVSPLHRYFSFPRWYESNNINKEKLLLLLDPPCIRCPNCKGCQLHMQFCSGAYGLRHLLSWIINRKQPIPGEKRNIILKCLDNIFTKQYNIPTLYPIPNYYHHRVCRFEVGPVVIMRHLTYSVMHQTIETMKHESIGVVCPRPLNFIDIFFGIFYATSDYGRDKRFYRVIQRTAMRAPAAQARALWEKLTFSPEINTSEVHTSIYKPRKGSDGKLNPRRVPVDWRYAPFFFSLVLSSYNNNNNNNNNSVGTRGISFKLWLPLARVEVLTAHVMEDDAFWKAPHTCETNNNNNNNNNNNENKWEGEVKCRRCYVPAIHWGLITRRHREEKDKISTILKVRRESMQRRVLRRTLQHAGEKLGPDVNDVAWINKHKCRAQYLALLIAYMMPSTVIGPHKQRHILPPPHHQ